MSTYRKGDRTRKQGRDRKKEREKENKEQIGRGEESDAKIYMHIIRADTGT